jgi:hypothetical protein
MAWLSEASHNSILLAPETVWYIYSLSRPSLVASLGPAFSGQCEDHLRLAFCALAAFDLKPYGACVAHDLAGLLGAPALDCDNYVGLAWHLFRLFRPISPTVVTALGWDGGAIGNHAQMQGQTPGSPDIYLDPTIGLVVNGCSLDGLVGDFVYPANCLASFFSFNARPVVAALDASVRDAIGNTRYRPSELLYCIRDPAKLASLPPRAHWLTPRA